MLIKYCTDHGDLEVDYLHPGVPTMVTMIDVEVEELCTNTVTSTPIIKPATGLDNTLSAVNTSPAALPTIITYRTLSNFKIYESHPKDMNTFHD